MAVEYIIMESTSLSNFITFSLHRKIKVQLDLPDIPNLDKLVNDPFNLDLKSLSYLEGPVSFYLNNNEALKSLIIDLVHSLILHIYLKSDLNPETAKICIEKIKYFKSNENFKIFMILSQFEDSLRKAILQTLDLNVNYEWAKIIEQIYDTFNYDVSSLKSWLYLQIVKLFFSQIDKANEEEIKFLLKSVNDFISKKYPLEDLKFIIIDSALYLISRLISCKILYGISKILRAIKDIKVPALLNSRFEKFVALYGLSVSNESLEVVDHLDIIRTQNQLKDKKLIFTRDVKFKEETYNISVFSAIITDTNEEVAVKQYRITKTDTIKRISQEIEIIRKLSTKPGPFPRFYGRFSKNLKDNTGNMVVELNLVMELGQHTLDWKIESLRRTKKEFSEDELLNNTRRLIEGFIVMSEQHPKIYHKDIKPENIYYNKNGDIFVAEFNTLTLNQLRETITTQGDVGGSARYMAPEIQDKVLLGLGGKFKRSKADVYSFGVTLYQMYTREAQTYNDPRQFHIRNKRIEGFKFEWLKKIVSNCLEENYHKRPSFRELLQFLPPNTISG